MRFELKGSGVTRVSRVSGVCGDVAHERSHQGHGHKLSSRRRSDQTVVMLLVVVVVVVAAAVVVVAAVSVAGVLVVVVVEKLTVLVVCITNADSFQSLSIIVLKSFQQ